MAASLATFAALALLASVIAWWGWQLFGPRAVQIPASGPANPAATLVAANLFGGAAAPESAAAPLASMLAGDARLIGIIAEEGRGGHALFRLQSGPKLVARGEEIAPGATLVSVEPDAVTIRDGAGERRFELRREASAGTRRAGDAVPPASVRATARPADQARATAPTCAPPDGFRGTVVRLNAELLGGIGRDSGQWRSWLAPIDGGLVVREGGGFGAMLGLRAGDRIVQANGIALGVPEDVNAAIVRPLVANQGVRLIGSRDGATHELWLANVACAG